VRGWQLVHFDQKKFNQSISTLDDISEFFLAWNVDYVTMVHIKWAFHYSLENIQQTSAMLGITVVAQRNN
jgi:hypothetical protein